MQTTDTLLGFSLGDIRSGAYCNATVARRIPTDASRLRMLKSGDTPPHPAARVVPCILVVDDQADAREMMQQFLSSYGFVVHTATDGLDALAVAQRVAPSIILMDLMMPRMDGFEATRRLKADSSSSAIPIIAFTASAMTNGPQLARAAGFDALLPKPCDLDMLVDELRKRMPPTNDRPA